METNYKLLEPINFEDPSNPDNLTTSIDINGSDPKGGFNKYISDVFIILILIVIILAIFRLMYGGVLYLTKDIGSKVAAGKEMIIGVFSGLVFILLIWLIFFTINPKFLENGIIINVIKATGLISDNVSTDANTNPNSNPDSAGNIGVKINGCSGEITKINNNSNYLICSSIKNNLNQMIIDAKKNNIDLTIRSAFRDTKTQIELRKKNCGTTQYDIYEKPSSQCRPPTAIPNRSNHEKGLAVDFNIPQHVCNNACQWLQKNGAKYGFYNNYDAIKEYWHWSTTGR
jgi:hypothetical protein